MDSKNCFDTKLPFEETVTIPETTVILHKAPHLSYFTGRLCDFVPPESFFRHLSYPILNDDYVLANIVLKNSSARDSVLTEEELSCLTVSSRRMSSFNQGRNTVAAAVSKTLNEKTKHLDLAESNASFHAFLKSGYRSKLFFDPSKVRACILTTGGLCPGLNAVIASMTKTLLSLYSVESVFAVRGGFSGFSEDFQKLSLETVEGLANQGGTSIGTSRGGFDETKIVGRLLEEKIDMLFVIGGDGTHRAAFKLFQRVTAQKLPITVVCLPKSIDNDLAIIDHTFGFYSAVEEARRAVDSIITEARSQVNCVGMVKVMGREAGHIAAAVTVCAGDVDICLLPEVETNLQEFVAKTRSALQKKKRCVIVFAEGIDKKLMDVVEQTDAGGNRKLLEVEKVLIQALKDGLRDVKFNIKFNDPKYMIRSVRANASDSVYCSVLGQNAVHGAMAGFTGFTSASVNRRMCMIPIKMIVESSPVTLDVNGKDIERLMNSMN